VTDYRDLRNRDFAEQRLREGRELEEQEKAFARARRERIARAQCEQHDAVDELRAELMAEIEAVRNDVAARYETLIQANGEALGLVQNEIVDYVHDAIKKIENELFGLVERRFGELMGRLDAFMPGERGKDFKFAGKDRSFKFASERESDDDVIDLPNPLVRRELN
jgi:DNA anti-recombination protein RmuC